MAEIIKFTGNNEELFSRQSADSLHAKAQVVVPETHTVLLIKDGVVSEALGGGRHDIFDTQNGLFRLKKDSDVATVDFVFVSKTAKLPMLWGTSSKVKTRDPLTDVPVSVGINGELEIRVKTPKKFYLELVGADKEYSMEKLKKRLVARLVGIVEQELVGIMRSERMSYIELSEHKVDLSKKLKAKLDGFFEEQYGLELCSFAVNGTIIPDEDMNAIEKKVEQMRACGKTCPDCGANVPAGSRFCPDCGASVEEKTCPSCGKVVPQGAKFCVMCGKKIR